MELFQKLYDFFKNLPVPEWLKKLISEINDIIINVLTQIGKEALEAIKTKIIEVAGEDLTNEEKFKRVFEYAKIALNLTHLKDSAINLAIEMLFNILKKEKLV